MSTPKTKSKPSRLCGIRSSDVLSRYTKWLKLLRKRNPRLREGQKMMVNTKTWKTFFIFTIECWCPPRRQYLPLMMPDGGWSWETPAPRNRVLKAIEAKMRDNND
jgi:hypothetical protein